MKNPRDLLEKGINAPKIIARLVGREKGVLIFGILFLILILYSLRLFVETSSYVALLFGIGGGIGLLILFRHWVQYSSVSEEREHGRTELILKPHGELQIEAPSPQKVIEMFSTLRETIQNRKILEPHGEIIGDDPRSKESLKQYTPVEREEVKKTIEEEARNHDEKAYNLLKDMMRKLQISFEEDLDETGDKRELKGVPPIEET